MPTKIILNTTPPLDAVPIGFFITAEESDIDAQRTKQVYVRFKVGLTGGGGGFIKIGHIEAVIKDQHFNAFLALQTIGGRALGVEIRDAAINYIVANRLIDGTAA